MTNVALVVKLSARSGMEDALAEFLSGAVDLANQEDGTPIWFALRTDRSTFWIVDAFPGEQERQAHLDGPIAAALMDNGKFCECRGVGVQFGSYSP
jgi:quinol monooxygenase YgiN